MAGGWDPPPAASDGRYHYTIVISIVVFICSAGVTFYNQLSEIFEKRRREISTICKSEKERLQKILEKAKQIKGIIS